MATVTVVCIERGKTKTYTGELISNGIKNLMFATYDQKGSSYIKQIQHEKIVNLRIEE